MNKTELLENWQKSGLTKDANPARIKFDNSQNILRLSARRPGLSGTGMAHP